jgi:hypothetical protein
MIVKVILMLSRFLYKLLDYNRKLIKVGNKMVQIVKAYKRTGSEWCSCCGSDKDTKRIKWTLGELVWRMRKL